MAATRISRREYSRVHVDDNHEKGRFEANDIHVVASRGQRFYIGFAVGALTGKGKDGEDVQKFDHIKLSGMGNAVYNALNIAEIVKRSVAGLHQITEVGNVVMHDEYQSRDNAEVRVTRDRKVTTITITLSTKPLDTANPGYQAPLADSLVTGYKPRTAADAREPRAEGRGRGRGRGAPRLRGRLGRGAGAVARRPPLRTRAPREEREEREEPTRYGRSRESVRPRPAGAARGVARGRAPPRRDYDDYDYDYDDRDYDRRPRRGGGESRGSGARYQGRGGRGGPSRGRARY